jgi:hypothetical protein
MVAKGRSLVEPEGFAQYLVNRVQLLLYLTALLLLLCLTCGEDVQVERGFYGFRVDFAARPRSPSCRRRSVVIVPSTRRHMLSRFLHLVS